MSSNNSVPTPVNLLKYAYLSIATGFAVFALKLIAWWFTGSVGLLSDALESIVNIVAAVIALLALRTSMKPADQQHHFGRGKAEYFSASVEGFMILVAALVIIATAVERFLHPREIEQLGWGLGISTGASILNGVVALMLIRAGKQHRSPVLDADGRHLMTDVWTSAGVVVGVGLVQVTGYLRLDAIVAMAVGLNIVLTGVNLLRESTSKLMDKSLSNEDHETIVTVLKKFESDEVKFHALQTRESGRHRFVSMHVLVPGAWTVQQSHDLVEDVEKAIISVLPDTTVHTHAEPIEDPRAWEDIPTGSYIWE